MYCNFQGRGILLSCAPDASSPSARRQAHGPKAHGTSEGPEAQSLDKMPEAFPPDRRPSALARRPEACAALLLGSGYSDTGAFTRTRNLTLEGVPAGPNWRLAAGFFSRARCCLAFPLRPVFFFFLGGSSKGAACTLASDGSWKSHASCQARKV